MFSVVESFFFNCSFRAMLREKDAVGSATTISVAAIFIVAIVLRAFHAMTVTSARLNALQNSAQL
jgi:hypothetical protein